MMAAAAGASLVDPGPVLAAIIEQTAESCERRITRSVSSPARCHSRAPAVSCSPSASRSAGRVWTRDRTPICQARAGSVDHADKSGLRADGVPTGRPGTPRAMDHQDLRAPRPRSQTLPLDEVIATARSIGAHLLECSGNNNPANFGLMSVAQWDGVPLAEVVSTLRPSSEATGVLVSGVDPDQPSGRPLQARAGCFRSRHSIRSAPFSRFG